MWSHGQSSPLPSHLPAKSVQPVYSLQPSLLEGHRWGPGGHLNPGLSNDSPAHQPLHYLPSEERMINNSPALIHEKFEAVRTRRWNWKMEAVASDAPDDRGRVDVAVRDLVVHQLPENDAVRPARRIFPIYTKYLLSPNNQLIGRKSQAKQPIRINHF